MTVVTVFGARHGRENTVTTDATVTERESKMKNVQISYELFMDLLRYHLMGDDFCMEAIRQGLEKKLDAMVRHDLYVKYKTAPTAGEREKARREYLDRRGVPEDFRW